DAAQQGSRRGARGRLLPFPRTRRRARGARAAVDGPHGPGSRPWRRDHDRARPLPLRLRRPTSRGHRPRHAGRVRGAHAVPVRPHPVNTIDTMLLEERRYAPDPEFARQANAQPEIYDRDWEDIWEGEGRTSPTSASRAGRRLTRDARGA